MNNTPSLNLSVVARFGGTVFLRLPQELQRSCDGCSCDFCRHHPHLTPSWDTLAVPMNDPQDRNDCSYTVHMPVAPSAAEQARLNARLEAGA